MANVLSFMAETYSHLADHPSSLQYALRSLEVFERLNGKNSAKNMSLYLAIADTYRKMGDLAGSEKFGNLAKELQQRQGESSRK